MNSSHLAVGAGAGGFVALLAPLLAHYLHLDPDLASDLAGLVVGVGGGAIAAGYAYMNRTPSETPHA